MAIILDGKQVADLIKQELKQAFSHANPQPTLTIVQVGNDERSTIYVKKKEYGEAIGVKVEIVKFDESITEEELKKEIESLNKINDIHAIIIQLPLPSHIDRESITSVVDPKKDVDGLAPVTFFQPATARGVMSLLDFYKIEIENKKAVVVGRSALVGAPIARVLEQKGAQVTVCHRGTQDLAAATRQADLVVVAAGCPGLITRDYVRHDQVIIDVGINPVLGKNESIRKKIVGDVSYYDVEGIVNAISPVPGGVGPLTVASLFQNVCDAYYNDRTLLN